jgi:hypothetical protein
VQPVPVMPRKRNRKQPAKFTDFHVETSSKSLRSKKPLHQHFNQVIGGAVEDDALQPNNRVDVLLSPFAASTTTRKPSTAAIISSSQLVAIDEQQPQPAAIDDNLQSSACEQHQLPVVEQHQQSSAIDEQQPQPLAAIDDNHQSSATQQPYPLADYNIADYTIGDGEVCDNETVFADMSLLQGCCDQFDMSDCDEIDIASVLLNSFKVHDTYATTYLPVSYHQSSAAEQQQQPLAVIDDISESSAEGQQQQQPLAVVDDNHESSAEEHQQQQLLAVDNDNHESSAAEQQQQPLAVIDDIRESSAEEHQQQQLLAVDNDNHESSAAEQQHPLALTDDNHQLSAIGQQQSTEQQLLALGQRHPLAVIDVSRQVDQQCESTLEINPHGKRRGDQSLWKKNVAKRKRNNGEEYENRSGNIVEAIEFKNYDCQCPLKCYDCISEEEKRHNFELYWNSAREAKIAFLCGHVHQVHVKRRYTENQDDSRRQKTRVFHFIKDDSTKVHICKKMFCQTLQISNGALDRALKRDADQSFCEKRGKKAPANKTTTENVDHVRQHINSFPKYISHYSRKDNPNCRYLSPNLNLALMYRMYKEDCDEQQKKPVGETKYRKVFHDDFNLKFKEPKKDTCSKCDSYAVQIAALQLMKTAEGEEKLKQLQEERDRHLAFAGRAREQLVADRHSAKDASASCSVITFDLQSALPTPKLSTNIVYYKRQLMVYNLGIHDCKNEIGFMHVWDESIASRGAQEIGSCICKFVADNGDKEKSELIAWSDSCGGQNRNIKIALIFLSLVGNEKLPYSTITQKFLESGHSFLPNDSDFSDIEKRRKFHPQIYHPQEWYDIIAEARTTANPFHVIKMTADSFVSTASLEQHITNRKRDATNGKVDWLHIRQIQYRRQNPKTLFVRYSHDPVEDWKEVSLAKRADKTVLSEIESSKLYEKPREINPMKVKDLISMLHLIPPVYHDFYRRLTSGSKSADEDVDGLADVLDFEVQL